MKTLSIDDIELGYLTKKGSDEIVMQVEALDYNDIKEFAAKKGLECHFYVGDRYFAEELNYKSLIGFKYEIELLTNDNRF